jgi:ATP-dependent helicase HrpB
VAAYDRGRERVVGRTVTRYHDLVLREEQNAAVDPDAAADVLADALADRAAELFGDGEEAGRLLDRLLFARYHASAYDWPRVDNSFAQSVIRDACYGRRAMAEVRGAALAAAVRGRLPYPLDRLLEDVAPDAVEVPTGNRIRLAYDSWLAEKADAPVLAVRLQELFGLPDTPRIANGRIPVILHLLGPNYRPVQVTSDLASFWANTYPQVRKDLRARYPKHSWPENPLAAPPEARGGRRKS